MTDVTAIADGLARFEARGPCTDAERRAAAWLHDELRAAGWEAWVETHWVRPQWALSLALHATLGVVASVVAISAPLVGLVMAGVAALFPFRWLFPRRATQNVLVEPAGDGIVLLIAAPYAAPRGGVGRRFVEGRELWVAGALALVAVCAGLRLLDLDGLWLGALQFVPTLFLLLALAAAGDAAVSRYAGGERPPAVAVALHDSLRPERLSPALLLHGALRAHLRARPARCRDRARAGQRVRHLAPAAARGRRGRGRHAPPPAAPAADAVDRRGRRGRAGVRPRLRRRARRRAQLVLVGVVVLQALLVHVRV